ncbi:YesL family protein [Aquibacillus albus]|uniref:Membrane protein YesL n=1 Tax=Aquibacillus albus TaxID=1168171 RepID=A0ABS2MWX8_9BACI|nr:YesL family protein [Aquibacillus albus]MBM7570361.1 putative membrane protein YesL [Aquibacillus albus]
MYTGVMGGFYRISEWIMRLAYVNILWITFTLMGLILFGFSPATVALFSVTRKWIQGSTDIPVFKTFWKTYKQEFIKSNILGLILAVIGYVLYLDFQLVVQTPNSLLQLAYFPVMLIILIYLLMLLYVFPVFVHYEVNILHLLKNALLFTLMRPFNTITMAIGVIAVYFLMSVLPGLIPFFGISLLAYVLMWSSYLAFTKLERKQTEAQSVSNDVQD